MHMVMRNSLMDLTQDSEIDNATQTDLFSMSKIDDLGINLIPEDPSDISLI